MAISERLRARVVWCERTAARLVSGVRSDTDESGHACALREDTRLHDRLRETPASVAAGHHDADAERDGAAERA